MGFKEFWEKLSVRELWVVSCDFVEYWGAYAPKNLYQYCANVVQILCKCCTSIVQMLHKYRANIVQLLSKYCTIIEQILWKYWKNCCVNTLEIIVWILFKCLKCRKNIVQILYKYCTNIVQIFHKHFSNIVHIIA